MALYDKDGASLKALEMASLAIEAGLLKEMNAAGYDDPTRAGKAIGEFLGGFIKELATHIESL